MERNKRNWCKGVLVLIAVLVAAVGLGAPLQYAYGIWGLLYTELLILLVAVVAIIVLKIDYKDMLRLKMPRARHLVAVVLMVVSGGIIAATTGYVGFLFYPQGLEFIGVFMDISSATPPFITWLIIAVSPAICEEILHRGVILYTFTHSEIKGKWTVIFWMGVVFGVFHLDPGRFVITGILGMILAYIMLETDNFLLPVLYHLLNNSTSTLSGLLSPTDAVDVGEGIATIVEQLPLIVGSFLILSAFALFVLRLGARLLGPRQSSLNEDELAQLKAYRRKTRTLTVATSIALVVLGIQLLGQASIY